MGSYLVWEYVPRREAPSRRLLVRHPAGLPAGAVEEERARRAAAARAYAEELEGLPLKPVSSWPAPVRVLVRQREAAAAEVRASRAAEASRHVWLVIMHRQIAQAHASFTLSPRDNCA